MSRLCAAERPYAQRNARAWYRAAAPCGVSSMTTAPQGAQRCANAACVFCAQLRDFTSNALPPSFAAACKVLPKMPRAALLEGAALTTP
eukprot:2416749-Alexandrium_andersonii.AAC.1